MTCIYVISGLNGYRSRGHAAIRDCTVIIIHSGKTSDIIRSQCRSGIIPDNIYITYTALCNGSLVNTDKSSKICCITCYCISVTPSSVLTPSIKQPFIMPLFTPAITPKLVSSAFALSTLLFTFPTIPSSRISP